jgi:hypothetical protein
VVVGTQNANRYTGFSDCTLKEWFEKETPGWEMICWIKMPSFTGKDKGLFVGESGDMRDHPRLLWNSKCKPVSQDNRNMACMIHFLTYALKCRCFHVTNSPSGKGDVRCKVIRYCLCIPYFVYCKLLLPMLWTLSSLPYGCFRDTWTTPTEACFSSVFNH